MVFHYLHNCIPRIVLELRTVAMPGDESDDEWLPLPHEKPKPKNFALLQARKKKFKRKAKIVIKCDVCNRKFTTKKQMNEHKETHGIVSYVDHCS